jgi:hypothetical protein
LAVGSDPVPGPVGKVEEDISTPIAFMKRKVRRARPHPYGN